MQLTSRGVFIPHWTGEDLGLERAYNLTGHKRIAHYNPGAGYDSIEAVNFFTSDLGKTVDHTPYDTEKINYTDNLVISAFEQNPFYGYLPQALGMIIAKMLDLNVIWLLWLGRIFNLLFYAGVISLAIRKTPILKMPLFFVACLPISIYQAASLSIDSMIIGLGILAVGYFLYMYSAKKDSLETREVIKFSALCLILGLCKLDMHCSHWNCRNPVEQILHADTAAFLEVKPSIHRLNSTTALHRRPSGIYAEVHITAFYI